MRHSITVELHGIKVTQLDLSFDMFVPLEKFLQKLKS